MRIVGQGSPLPAAGRRDAGRAGPAGGFSLGGSATAGGAVAAGGAAPALAPAALHALVALQAAPDPAAGRRRRAVRRGSDLLDMLDEVRLALLQGGLPATILASLRGELETARAAADDPDLEDALREIEVRAAVEVAKLELYGAAA